MKRQYIKNGQKNFLGKAKFNKGGDTDPANTADPNKLGLGLKGMFSGSGGSVSGADVMSLAGPIIQSQFPPDPLKSKLEGNAQNRN